MFEILFLSFVQGLTEFIPVSSSAHLILFSRYLDFSNQRITLDMSLHIGSLLAVIIYFKNDLINFIHNRALYQNNYIIPADYVCWLLTCRIQFD